ncbi:MAG: tldD protein, partial [Proteobacteria bacterium]|nr:tldD protein [Pseudomonadota bacterium]
MSEATSGLSIENVETTMANDSLAIARQSILEPAGLGNGDIDRVMTQLLGASIDAADVYMQTSRYESWALEDGIVKEASHNIEQGVGVRAVSGEKTGFAYSDEVALPALLEAARSARAIAGGGYSGALAIEGRNPVAKLYPPVDPLQSMPEEEKIDLLRRLDEEARKLDPRVEQVMVSLVGAHDVVLVLGQDGVMHSDVRPLVRLNVSVIVQANGRREQGSSGGGGRADYRYFLEGGRASRYAREAVRQALVNLEAVAAPAGNMTVVLGPGWPGVLLHEAIGHGLEGDFNRKGTSAFSGRLGVRVASPLCTVVDDGTLPGRRGSLNIDDEGTPTQCTVLIENGILKGYMQDK